jgi:PAS domain-containing protein
VDTTIVPFLDRGGRPYQCVSIRNDITERKRIEAALREEREITETVNRIGQVLSAELDLQILVQPNVQLFLRADWAGNVTRKNNEWQLLVSTCCHPSLSWVAP